MLRTLLAERFNLKAHNETREQPIYALVLAKRAGGFGPELGARTRIAKPSEWRVRPAGPISHHPQLIPFPAVHR